MLLGPHGPGERNQRGRLDFVDSREAWQGLRTERSTVAVACVASTSG